MGNAVLSDLYRGPDRRQIPGRQLPWAVPAAGAAIFAITVTVAGWSTGVPVRTAGMMLMSTALVGALLLVVMAALTWKATGGTASLWLALAATSYAAVVLAQLLELQPWLFPGLAASSAMPSDVVPVGRAVTWAGLVCAALWHPVDARLTPLRVLLLGGAAAVLALLLLPLVAVPTSELFPPASGTFRPVMTAAAVARSSAAAQPTLLPAAWGLLAGILATQAHRRADPVLAWATLLGLALGGGEALRQLVGTPEAILAADLARTAALVTAAVGVGAGLVTFTTMHRREAGSATQARKSAERRLQVADSAQAELRHEAQNALAAVHAIASTLHTHFEGLTADERAELSWAVARETERLRALFASGEGLDGPLQPVPLARAVEPAVTGARAQGLTVHVDIPNDLAVVGCEKRTAQVVSALLDNARKHAPGSPVRLRASREFEGVVLRCQDRGPGIPVDERERVFRRGHRGRHTTSEGSGLGLTVAARMVDEQGGTMWVEDAADGGAVLAVWLARPDTGEAAAREDPVAGSVTHT